MKKICVISLLLLVVLLGCGKNDYLVHDFNYFAYDTPITISIFYDESDDYDFEQIDNDLENIIDDSNHEFDPNDETSPLYQLNSTQTLDMSDEFEEMLNQTVSYCQQTDGRYDPTSGVLIDLWSINEENYLPTQGEIDQALTTIDCEDINIVGQTLSIPKGMKIDFGSAVKGYASDEIKAYLIDQGVDSAIINLGGNVATIGSKPNGEDFNVGIMAPEIDNLTNESAISIEVNDKVVITSGINQRYFLGDDGTIYHHILDATTGYPVQNNLASVTIISDSGLQADILSTVCFILGLEEGAELINQTDNTEAIFITRDKIVYPTTTNLKIKLLDKSYQLDNTYIGT